MIRFISPEKLEQVASFRGLHKGRVLHRMHKHYCRKLHDRGICDKRCEITCNESLRRIFRTFDNPKDPYALLVWRCREAVAKWNEETLVAKPVTDDFGDPKFENVFQHLSEEFNEREAKKN